MEYLTRVDEISRFGENPGTRPIESLLRNGIVILDKWSGPTSHDVSAIVKQKLGLSKVGHGGTLDPMVSGVLTITLENACKIIPALQHLDKEYIGVMHLHKDVSDKELSNAVNKFIGKIKQLPPIRSAVARKVRMRTIYNFDILERDGKDVLFRMFCESGTYVRVMCHDIGKELGGAHMKELRRTKAGIFFEENSVKIQDIVDAYEDWKSGGNEKIRDYILPVEAGIEHLPKIFVKDSAVYSIAHGSPIYATGISKVSAEIKKDDLVAVLTLKGELVALAKSVMESGEMVKKKGLAANTDRVIIDKNAYPKM